MRAGGKSDAQHKVRQPTLETPGLVCGVALRLFLGVQLLTVTPEGCNILRSLGDIVSHSSTYKCKDCSLGTCPVNITSHS